MKQIMNESLKTAITELAWKTPYKPYSIGKGIVEKIFNNGNGSLPIFRFDETTKTVKVNRAIANIYDRRKLKMFMEDNGISDWVVKEVYYGYPDWYSHDF